MEDTYKFGNHNAADLMERGKNRYGTNANGKCDCPQCYGGGRFGMFACENCKGTGLVENSDGTDVLEKQEGIQKEDEEKIEAKGKKKVGPYYEEGDNEMAKGK